MEAVYSLITGFIVGVVFAILNLPVPAPPTLSGVIGIVGIFLGFAVVKYIR